MNLRKCIVKNRGGFASRQRQTFIYGYFHCWEQHSVYNGLDHSTNSKIYGIVEFEDGYVSRVDPEDIRFIDEEEDTW